MTDGAFPQIDPRLQPLVQFTEQGIPFNQVLGLTVVHLTAGRAMLRIPWRDEIVGDPFRPAIHGGVISALIDVAGGIACFSLMKTHRDRVSTIDLRVDYLRPGPKDQHLYGESHVIRMGNKVAVTRIEVFSATDVPGPGSPARETPIATGQAVYNVLRRTEV